MSLPSLQLPLEKPFPARESPSASRPRWKAKSKTLEVENAALKAESEAVKAENEALKVKLARLGKNSRTSSKPPSSDFVKPKAEQRQPMVSWRKGNGTIRACSILRKERK